MKYNTNNNIMKKFLLLLIACISILGYAQAPDLPQVFSPNAAELGKYGKIPVSYFNGLPNISIPLTELKAKGLHPSHLPHLPC
jgi:hypothetical protein